MKKTILILGILFLGMTLGMITSIGMFLMLHQCKSYPETFNQSEYCNMKVVSKNYRWPEGGDVQYFFGIKDSDTTIINIRVPDFVFDVYLIGEKIICKTK